MTTVHGKRTAHRRTTTASKPKKAHAPSTAATASEQQPPSKPGEPPIPSAAHEAAKLAAWAEPKATSLVELRAAAENDTLDATFKKHLADFRTAFAELRRQAPSVVFFGGARLTPGDAYYALAMAFGGELAQRGIPPKTGAGPGAMHAVPAGFIDVRDRLPHKLSQHLIEGVSRLAHLADQSTLGFNIKLPAEQKVSPAIERAAEIQLFAFRKFALYENVRGIVVFPGGFGTLDELLEVLVLAREGRTKDPIVLAGKAYWQPILDAWRASAERNGQDLLAGLLDHVLVTDDPHAAMSFVEGKTDVRAFEDEPEQLYKRMVRELKLASYVTTRQEKAVTFLGGAQLAPTDPALALARLIAEHVAGQGQPVRVGDDGNGANAVKDGAGEVQRVRWDPASTQSQQRRKKHSVDDVTFSERIPHKETLLRNSSAYVVLPDAARGHDELTTVLCQIQTGKLPRRPLLLVDSSYWKPIIDSWERAMVSSTHAYIEPEDMKLLRLVDSLDDAKEALAGASAGPTA
ncbi:MAG: LOG family protein [Deltaproteobacteria bacterium]|nr:LOG family protein [Deltaproteobacteria bacterium]